MSDVADSAVVDEDLQAAHRCPVPRPCPGPCNRAYRAAEMVAHRELERPEGQAWIWHTAGGWSKEHDPKLLAGISPTIADPNWCSRCKADFADDLAAFPDLCADLWDAGHEARPPRLRIVKRRRTLPGRRIAWIDELACGHATKFIWHPPMTLPPMVRTCVQCELDWSGTAEGKLRATEAGRRSTSRSGSPSGSPAWDAIDEIVTWAAWAEKRVRSSYPHSQDWRDPRKGSAEARARTLTRSITFLLEWRDQLFALPDGVEVGRAIRRLTKSAKRGTASDRLVHHLPLACPECDMRTLIREDGSDIVRCRSCQETWSPAAYRLIVAIEVDRRKTEEAETGAR